LDRHWVAQKMAPMGAKTTLRRKSPSAYKAALRVRARSRALSQKVTGVRGRTKARRLFAAGVPVTVEISGDAGLGGVLYHAGYALLAGRTHDADVALRFTNSNYRPSWGQSDWLECYFNRLGASPNGRTVCNYLDVPKPSKPVAFADRAALVWEALSIRADFVREAEELIGDDDFAAVHFRGSDKYVEAPAVPPGVLLDIAEREMDTAGLDRLFVASDERSFIALAAERYGEVAFSLPVEVFATDGIPPHFLEVDGEIKAREALVTMVALSRARLLVRTESLLPQWAATLAEDQRVVVASRA
jgi:hypothetical protein